jgi:hypothetical protein
MTALISRDEGKTWAKERQITAGSSRNHARRPLHAKDPYYAFWAYGDPTRFSESHLYFGDSRGNYRALPYEMTGDFAVLQKMP